METIVPKISSNLSKMWTKILNLENSLFPALKEELRLEELSKKEQKLISILDFAQIERNITVVSITNTPKDREEIARAFIAKSVYNIQTTRDLIYRLHNDRTLRMLCGWRYKNDIPSESKFSRVFKELSKMQIAQKTHEQFIKEYLSNKIFFYNATDATKIPLRQKALKVEKEKPKPKPEVKDSGPTLSAADAELLAAFGGDGSGLDVEAICRKKVFMRIEKKHRSGHPVTTIRGLVTDDAEYMIVSAGITSRSAKRAVKEMREKGIKVGLFRPITIWPFPEKEIYEYGKDMKAILVPEMNYGQIVLEVERAIKGRCEVMRYNKANGEIISPYEIIRAFNIKS
jgi:transposase